MRKVNIIEVIEIPSVLEVLPIVLEIEKETFLLVIVYCIPGPLGSFVDDLIFLINELPALHRMLIVGDFNLDQMLPEHVVKVDPVIQKFNLIPVLFLLCYHLTVITLFFFSKSDIFIQNLVVNHSAFNRHYITCFDERVRENLQWKQSPK